MKNIIPDLRNPSLNDSLPKVSGFKTAEDIKYDCLSKFMLHGGKMVAFIVCEVVFSEGLDAILLHLAAMQDKRNIPHVLTTGWHNFPNRVTPLSP